MAQRAWLPDFFPVTSRPNDRKARPTPSLLRTVFPDRVPIVIVHDAGSIVNAALAAMSLF